MKNDFFTLIILLIITGILIPPIEIGQAQVTVGYNCNENFQCVPVNTGAQFATLEECLSACGQPEIMGPNAGILSTTTTRDPRFGSRPGVWPSPTTKPKSTTTKPKPTTTTKPVSTTTTIEHCSGVCKECPFTARGCVGTICKALYTSRANCYWNSELCRCDSTIVDVDHGHCDEYLIVHVKSKQCGSVEISDRYENMNYDYLNNLFAEEKKYSYCGYFKDEQFNKLVLKPLKDLFSSSSKTMCKTVGVYTQGCINEVINKQQNAQTRSYLYGIINKLGKDYLSILYNMNHGKCPLYSSLYFDGTEAKFIFSGCPHHHLYQNYPYPEHFMSCFPKQHGYVNCNVNSNCTTTTTTKPKTTTTTKFLKVTSTIRGGRQTYNSSARFPANLIAAVSNLFQRILNSNIFLNSSRLPWTSPKRGGVVTPLTTPPVDDDPVPGDNPSPTTTQSPSPSTTFDPITSWDWGIGKAFRLPPPTQKPPHPVDTEPVRVDRSRGLNTQY